MVGPRKIPMKKRDSREKLNVTFTKRRQGLFHKASELSRLCDAQVAVLVSSPNGKYHYSFAPTSVDAVLDAFLAGRTPERVSAGVTQEAHRLAEEISGMECTLRRVKAGGCPWEALRRYEESITSAEELRALYDSLSKLKAKYGATCSRAGSNAVVEQVATSTLAYGYDMAGNWYLPPPVPVSQPDVNKQVATGTSAYGYEVGFFPSANRV